MYGHIATPDLTGVASDERWGAAMEAFTSDTLIRDVLTAHPGAAEVFERHGLACAGCMGADMETLASVAVMHDMPVDDLIADLKALRIADEGEK